MFEARFLLVIAAAGCSLLERDLGPDLVHGRTIEGFEEALYDLSVRGKGLGVVTVWSRGARSISGEPPATTIVQVGFTMENTGAGPMTLDLDEVRLDSVLTEVGLLHDLKASGQFGLTTIGPASSTDVEVVFALPRGIASAEVRAFRVKWTVISEADEYTEFTPFVQQERESAYVPVYAYYYPHWPLDDSLYAPFYDRTFRVVIVPPSERRIADRR